MRTAKLVASLLVCAILISCGGGGGNGSTTVTTSPSTPPLLTVIADSTLPLAGAGAAYNYTFRATGGAPPYTWSGSFLPTGLQFSTSGVLSGIVPISEAGFTQQIVFTVTDSAMATASKQVTFNVFGFTPDYVNLPQVGVRYSFGDFSVGNIGVTPIAWTTSGTLPAGLTLQVQPSSNTRDSVLVGLPTQAAHYDFSITATDSSTPPFSFTRNFSVDVEPTPPILPKVVLPVAVVGQPYSFNLFPQGGTPPFVWTVSGPPAGVSFDTTAGLLAGTPTAAGLSGIYLQVSDSSKPNIQRDGRNYQFLAEPGPLAPRNDSIATAPILYPGTYEGSISPYGDSVGTAAAGQDYFQYTAAGGSTVNIVVSNQLTDPALGIIASPLDPVVELVAASGQQLTICNDPLDDSSSSPIPLDTTPNGFDDACMDWQGDGSDFGAGRIARLSIRLPGDPSTQSTFYIHIFDWRGDARPDMLYTLSINQQ